MRKVLWVAARRRWSFGAALGLLLLGAATSGGAAGCGARGRSSAGAPDLGRADPEPSDPNASVDRLVQGDLEAELAASPTTATWLGAHGLDDRLDDLRADAQTREVGRTRALLDRVRALPEGALDAPHRLDRQLLEQRAAVRLFDLGELRARERNPLYYVDLAVAAIEPLVAQEAVPLADRLRLLNGRLWKLRPLFDEARRNLRPSASELFTRRAIDLAESEKDFLEETLPKAVQSVAEPRLIDEFRAADGDAARALDDFVGWLTRDFLPRARGDAALGRERFLARLRLIDGIDTTPEALIQVGERELKDARRRYDEQVRLVAQQRAGADVVRILEDDHARPEDLARDTQALVDALFGFVRERGLVPLPDGERPRVADMPPALWGYLRVSASPPLEARAREPVVWVDPVDRKWPDRRKQEHVRALNRSATVLALLHELAGHYLQGAADRRAPTTMQKIALAPVFLEGWAHYVERMVLDEGFLPGDARVRLAVERSVIVHAARLVAAVRLHCMGARIDDVVAQLVSEAGLDEAQARREAERATVDPMALSETLGRVEIEKLRDDYRAAHPGATLGAFHAALLAHGSPPVTVLRRLLLPERSSSPL
jgi:uncharacterized protein (DUF885 family)